jgi:hypothetical protein
MKGVFISFHGSCDLLYAMNCKWGRAATLGPTMPNLDHEEGGGLKRTQSPNGTSLKPFSFHVGASMLAG